MASELDTLKALIQMHDRQLEKLRLYNSYYEGEQPLSYMHPELIQQLEGQVRQVVINWPQMVVDAIEERLDIEGFRRPEEASGDKDLWEIWQDNDMDSGSQRAHVEALALGRSYVTVGSPDVKGDAPVITDESPMDMIAVTDPKTRRTGAALRRWSSDGVELPASVANMATLYLPNSTIIFRKDDAGAWAPDGRRDDHNLGQTPVVPILNRARRKSPLGVSEMKLILPISDAACKIATDMMVGANFHALPRYWATGVSESDFVDENNNPVSIWKTVTGRMWATEEEVAKLGQFEASDLSNFHKTLDTLAQLVASLCGMPPHYLGFTTDNPASADAIRSSETRLVKRAERKQGMFEEGWEQVMRLAMRISSGKWDPTLRRLETAWRDPSTPTVGQVYDAAIKAYQADVVPLKFTRRKLGYNDVEIGQMEEMDAEAAAKDPVGQMTKLLGQQQPLVTEPAPVPAGA
jgi:hypothetical protein